ncbi:MAG: hypothetical protein ACRDQ1_00630, partial [Sciscionella sp.]
MRGRVVSAESVSDGRTVVVSGPGRHEPAPATSPPGAGLRFVAALWSPGQWKLARPLRIGPGWG